jgi:hypothetical protein
MHVEVPELTLRHIGAGVAPRNTVGVLCVPTYVTVESLSVCVGHKPPEPLPGYACLLPTDNNNTVHERRRTAISTSRILHVISVLRFHSYGM